MKLLTKIFAIVLIGSTVVACTDSKKESKAETAMEEIKDSFKSEQSDLKYHFVVASKEQTKRSGLLRSGSQ